MKTPTIEGKSFQFPKQWPPKGLLWCQWALNWLWEGSQWVLPDKQVFRRFLCETIFDRQIPLWFHEFKTRFQKDAPRIYVGTLYGTYRAAGSMLRKDTYFMVQRDDGVGS